MKKDREFNYVRISSIGTKGTQGKGSNAVKPLQAVDANISNFVQKTVTLKQYRSVHFMSRKLAACLKD
jgi:hypothetical protein